MTIAPHLHNRMTGKGLRIGLLGGSFNPAHEGHRQMSLYALKRLGLNQVWWLVSPQNPLKSSDDMAPLSQRLAQARRTAHHPRIVITDIEAQLGTRYTVETLRALRQRFPYAHFIWLMGADNLRQIPLWRDWTEIFHLVPVAVFRRPGYPAGRGIGQAAQHFSQNWLRDERGLSRRKIALPAWRVFDNPLNPISATRLRKEKATWQKQKRT